MAEAIHISFVIPCYRSEHTLMPVVTEIEDLMKSHNENAYEIVLVNDGSPDNVWQVIKEGSERDSHIVGINLAKNFGQHCALMAGYHHARGHFIVSLDDDGQSPIDKLFLLMDKFSVGYDAIYATYTENHKGFIRRFGSDLSYKMTNYMLDIKENYPKGSSFFAMKQYVKDEIIRYEHPFPFLAGLVFRTTHNICMIPVQKRKRELGKSGYTFKSLLSLWINGFTAFSVKPLEFGAYLGFGFAIFGFIIALISIIKKILYPEILLGWSSLFAALMVMGGIIMIMLGLIGEYIGRIYICLNKSPQFVIKDIVQKEQV
jgi:undecaprenyl-phosphate 4-deoxy-4-formamido-L-arabinose transferase